MEAGEARVLTLRGLLGSWDEMPSRQCLVKAWAFWVRMHANVSGSSKKLAARGACCIAALTWGPSSPCSSPCHIGLQTDLPMKYLTLKKRTTKSTTSVYDPMIGSPFMERSRFYEGGAHYTRLSYMERQEQVPTCALVG